MMSKWVWVEEGLMMSGWRVCDVTSLVHGCGTGVCHSFVEWCLWWFSILVTLAIRTTFGPIGFSETTGCGGVCCYILTVEQGRH